MPNAIEQWEQLGRDGFTVSICCGPCGLRPFAWTVMVAAPTGEMFVRPMTARSFDHAVAVAAAEIVRRGWRQK